jgi:hypothetical protein
MRVGRAHKVRVRHIGHLYVVGVLASARQETVVFLAAQGFPNVGEFGKVRCTHGLSPENVVV